MLWYRDSKHHTLTISFIYYTNLLRRYFLHLPISTSIWIKVAFLQLWTHYFVSLCIKYFEGKIPFRLKTTNVSFQTRNKLVLTFRFVNLLKIFPNNQFQQLWVISSLKRICDDWKKNTKAGLAVRFSCVVMISGWFVFQ